MVDHKSPEIEEEKIAAQDAAVDGDGCVASREETLEAELVASREEVEKQKDLYLRTRAETDNFRRRMQREKDELSKFANENILREVLPVMDNLQRAVDHATTNDKSGSTLLDGVVMTLSQFKSVLDKSKVVVVEAKGVAFDPACHEAMGQLECDECLPNTVVEVLQEGYTLNGRLLRPALVMLSKAVTAPAADSVEEASKK